MKAIFAVNALNGFGTGTDMPWPRSKDDLKRFKEITTGHTVIMGRNTWESNMPKPLPNRRNCVLSSSLEDSRCEVFKNITDLLMEIKIDEQAFVIGGEQVLWNLRPHIDTVYLTRFNSKIDAEVKLDTDSFLRGFKCVSMEDLGDHTFEIYQKI